MFGAKLCVHYWEVVPCSEGPLSEVPLYLEIRMRGLLTYVLLSVRASAVSMVKYGARLIPYVPIP